MSNLSINSPLASKAEDKSLDVTDPKRRSPLDTFEEIFISIFKSFFPKDSASLIIFFSLNAFCFKFSSKTFFAELVAIIAFPCGIKKFLA